MGTRGEGKEDVEGCGKGREGGSYIAVFFPANSEYRVELREREMRKRER